MMPGPLLHFGATMLCAHGGQAMPTVTSPRVVVSGQPVALSSGPYTITACAMPPPPAGNGPCVTAMFYTSALRVKSLAQPVLLLDSQATCVPTGTPLLPGMAQPRVVGI